ncbi:hypothetical protein [Oceanobacillus alkalisoli]|uniref:hypothetical protein n=1 Tax=Oceanobacillus alkalisoli TaxID=2925113 RepID=UPI001EE4BFA4|nr:hypothetical protein [Oceanobacillus alkalisoli]MCG5103206.1 hypothetical protein [Oceanobacillus alkalisoli]
MEIINKKLTSMSDSEKDNWIFNLARVTKEDKRNAFLSPIMNQSDQHLITADLEWIEALCEDIESGKVYFECTSYEVYGESYWDRDFKYDYFDEFRIGDDLLRAFQLTEELLYQKDYIQASKFYEMLCMMVFQINDGDTEEWEELELEDLVEENIIELDLHHIAQHAIYAKYQAMEREKRPAAIFNYFTWKLSNNLSMEEIFTVGPEALPNLDLFMEDWIVFLGNKNGDLAGKLLIEACMYQGGIRRLCETAKDVSRNHPILYKYACEYLVNRNQMIECEKLGLEALHQLPENLIIRARIADLTAVAANSLEHHNIVETCYVAAFYSDSSLSNYFRLFQLNEDGFEVANKAAKHAKTLPEQKTDYFNRINRQLLTNNLSKEQKKVIDFINAEFDVIYEHCKKDTTALGWTNSFIGIAVPLFILMLNKRSEITKAGQQLINSLAHRLGYTDSKLLENQFLTWKEKIDLSAEQYEKYIQWLTKIIERRTDAIVGGGYRKSYYKAAALIASLGETLESNGDLNARERIIEHYKKVHSRKRAFKSEFERFHS